MIENDVFVLMNINIVWLDLALYDDLPLKPPKLFACFIFRLPQFQSALMSLKVNENAVWMSNSLGMDVSRRCPFLR